jgi:Fic-DOC domain mobile mystery protein B
VTDPLTEGQDCASTPLEPEELEQLIPSYITLRSELNEAEQAGISDADRWAFSRRRHVLDEAFLRRLHHRMFRSVWAWAGELRRTERNIGIDAYRIPQELRQLVEDARFWVDNVSYEPDEIAVRFHHRLVAIHPFPNGNGRHARLAADLLLRQLGRSRFSWGRINLVEPHVTRQAYIAALRKADAHDFTDLLRFARS